MRCPHCDAEFLLGQDHCDGCGSALSQLNVPGPKRGCLHKLILRDPLSQLNAPKPIILRRDDSVATAIARMQEARFGSVLVVDDEGSLVGIFTEHDSLGRVDRDQRNLEEIRLEEVMTRDPDSLQAKDTIALALNRMSAGGYRHVPIVRDGKPTGFCSIRGILRYIAENALAKS